MVLAIAAVGASVGSGDDGAQVADLERGQCIDLPADAPVTAVDIVPCADPHDAQVVTRLPLAASAADVAVGCRGAVSAVSDPGGTQLVEAVLDVAAAAGDTEEDVCLVRAADGRKLESPVIAS